MLYLPDHSLLCPTGSVIFGTEACLDEWLKMYKCLCKKAGGVSQGMLFTAFLPLQALSPTETILGFWNDSRSSSAVTTLSQACFHLCPSQWNHVTVYMHCKTKDVCVTFPALLYQLVEGACCSWLVSSDRFVVNSVASLQLLQNLLEQSVFCIGKCLTLLSHH